MTEFQMNKRRFAIVTLPRSGSTYLRLLLNGHSQIRCHCEVLLNSYGAADGFGAWLNELRKSVVLQKIWRSRLGWKTLGNRLVRNNWDSFDAAMRRGIGFPAPWMNVDNWHDKNIMSRECIRDEKAVGIKVMEPALMTLPYVMRHILRDNWTVIALTRKSVFLRALSWYRKDVTQVAHTNTSADNAIHVNPDVFFRYIAKVLRQERRYQEFCAQARACGCSVIGVTYEDLIQDVGTHFDKICHGLHVDAQNTTVPTIKRINSAMVSDNILNYDDLYQHLVNKVDKGSLPKEVLNVN